MSRKRQLWFYRALYAIIFMSVCLIFAHLYTRPGVLSAIKIEPKEASIIDLFSKQQENAMSGSQLPDFQVVNISQTALYVYSALLGEDNLRIIALKRRDTAIRGLYCVLWYPPDHFKSRWRASTVEASVKNLHEHHNLDYTAAFITCPLQEKVVMSNDGTGKVIQRSVALPGKVSLTSSPHDVSDSAPDQLPMTHLPVILGTVIPGKRKTSKLHAFNRIFKGDQLDTTKTLEEENNLVEFTVCVPFLPKNFGNVARLIEKIEMSRLLGAGRVVFYRHSTTAHVDAALRMYVREREEEREDLEVVVHSWRLPSVFSTKTVYRLGQVAAINDCLHRYKLRSKYIVFTDLDQHVIPRRHHTWHQLIAHQRTPGVAGFSFRTVVFREEWSIPIPGAQDSDASPRSVILQATRREACLSAENSWTRMIVNPLSVEEMGIDSAWSFTRNIYNVPAEEGLVHQYRSVSSDDLLRNEERSNCTTSELDTYMVDQYGQELSAALGLPWSKPSENPGEATVKRREDESPDEKDNQDLPPSALPVMKHNSQLVTKQDLPHVALPVKDHNFQLVSGLGTPLFVYSALWRGDNVRLVIIKKQKLVINDVYCVFLQESTRFTEKAVVKNFYQFVHPFTSASVTCPITNRKIKDGLPLFVGLVTEKNLSSTPKELFIVEGRESEHIERKLDAEKEINRVEFTVCIPAMFNFGNVARLVEKIEMSRLLGAGRVVFYRHSTTAHVDAALRMYVREREEGREDLEVVVHNWRLPSLAGKAVTLPYFGQLASIDDCLHRYRWTSRYTEFSDMDEFIVPLQHKNRSQLLADRERLKPGSTGFMFRCTVFRSDYWQPLAGWDKEAEQFGSSILGYNHRDDFVCRPKVRSKLIVKPKLVEEMGVHFMMNPAKRTDIVPPELGLLYHYRKPIDKCANQTTDSRVAQHYGKKLALRLQAAWAKLPGVSLGWKLPQKKDFKECRKAVT